MNLDQNGVKASEGFDAIVVGAGFAGLYMCHRLRESGRRVRVYEAGTDVGGTWYWNRYPGARCDAESLAYSYSFSKELDDEWEWSERYATQPEILRYLGHVADRFDLRSDIRFETRVASATYEEVSNKWQVTTEAGNAAHAPFLIMATGCLSVPLTPDIPGLDDFAGARYQASQWPHEGVDFSGQRVGVIGTGSSGIQAIPVIAEQAEHVTVFQRTPNFSVPAHNQTLETNFVTGFKENYPEHRQLHRLGLTSGFGDLEITPREFEPPLESAIGPDNVTFDAACESSWDVGGAVFLRVASDILTNEEANQRVADFVHRKIRSTVTDQETAEALCPTSYPIGTKRICVDSDYYATYNRANVRLVDLQKTPLAKITESGVQIDDAGGDEHVELDALVLATGFDAMTGALKRIDIRGVDGETLSDRWAAGPRAYLGLMVSHFPNLFTITGPGSPSVLSNMVVSIEQHVDLIMSCLAEMEQRGAAVVQATTEAEEGWVAHVNDVASATLLPKGGSWYLGANVPGKPRVFMPYAAGVGIYRQVCDQMIEAGWQGFSFAP